MGREQVMRGSGDGLRGAVKAGSDEGDETGNEGGVKKVRDRG